MPPGGADLVGTPGVGFDHSAVPEVPVGRPRVGLGRVAAADSVTVEDGVDVCDDRRVPDSLTQPDLYGRVVRRQRRHRALCGRTVRDGRLRAGPRRGQVRRVRAWPQGDAAVRRRPHRQLGAGRLGRQHPAHVRAERVRRGQTRRTRAGPAGSLASPSCGATTRCRAGAGSRVRSRFPASRWGCSASTPNGASQSELVSPGAPVHKTGAPRAERHAVKTVHGARRTPYTSSKLLMSA